MYGQGGIKVTSFENAVKNSFIQEQKSVFSGMRLLPGCFPAKFLNCNMASLFSKGFRKINKEPTPKQCLICIHKLFHQTTLRSPWLFQGTRHIHYFILPYSIRCYWQKTIIKLLFIIFLVILCSIMFL